MFEGVCNECPLGYYLPTESDSSCVPCEDPLCLECNMFEDVCTNPLPPTSCPGGFYLPTATGLACDSCPTELCTECEMLTGFCN